MPEKIEPALSAEEWARVREKAAQHPHAQIDYYEAYPGEEEISAKGIAVLNWCLPDSDRKITREWVRAIRDRAEAAIEDNVGADAWPWVIELQRIADALESYLPPSE